MMLIWELDTDFYTQDTHELLSSQFRRVTRSSVQEFCIFLGAEIRRFPYITERESMYLQEANASPVGRFSAAKYTTSNVNFGTPQGNRGLSLRYEILLQ